MYDKGHIIWSITIIALMLFPNIVFTIWMLLGSMRKLRSRDTLARVATGGCIQGLTVTRLDHNHILEKRWYKMFSLDIKNPLS